MERVGGHPVADQLRVDGRAALLGELQFLEDDDAGAFAHDEAVALAIERTAGVQRIVVARRQRAHRGEAADAHRRDRRLGAARDHHVGVVRAG